MLSSKGWDLVFTRSDGVTALPAEIEAYDPAVGRLVAWVKANVSNSEDTLLYVYFGAPVNSPAQDSAVLWADYSIVYHLAESSGTVARDSTFNHNDGVLVSMTPTNAGPTGGAQEFGPYSGPIRYGEGDMITVADRPAWNVAAGQYTFEFWVNVRNASALPPLLTGPLYLRPRAVVGAPGTGLYLSIPTSSGGAGACEVLYGTQPISYLSTPDGRFHQIVVVFDAVRGRCDVYSDGQLVGSDTVVQGTTAFGAHDLLLGSFVNSYWLDGMLDEFRAIPYKALSPEWIRTEYRNQSSPATFSQFGVLEPRPY